MIEVFKMIKGENMKISNNMSTCSLPVEQIIQNKKVA